LRYLRPYRRTSTKCNKRSDPSFFFNRILQTTFHDSHNNYINHNSYISQKRLTTTNMASKISNTFNEAVGRAKEKIGQATHNEDGWS